jgi:hypothetical protein
MATRLQRSHSWPPFKLQLHSPFAHHSNKNIDEDPFSFFISTNDGDEEQFVADYMSGGIEVPRARSLSPLRKRRRQGQTGFASEDAKAIRMLKKWMRRMEPKYFDRKRKLEEEDERHMSPEMLPRAFPLSPPSSPHTPQPQSPNHRGRAHLRKPVRDLEQNGETRQVRSHSGRPRLWRAPESDIWTVDEEREDDSGLGIVLETPAVVY